MGAIVHQQAPLARKHGVLGCEMSSKQRDATFASSPGGARNWRERTVIKAFVLIVVDPSKTIDVFAKLRAVDGIAEVYQVMGPYDIVAVVEVPTLTDVPGVISRHIRAVDGIESTTTCVTFPEANG